MKEIPFKNWGPIDQSQKPLVGPFQQFSKKEYIDIKDLIGNYRGRLVPYAESIAFEYEGSLYYTADELEKITKIEIVPMIIEH